MKKLKRYWVELVIGALAVLFFSIVASVCLYKYHHRLYTMLDLSIINQVFWNTAHGQWYQMTIHQTSYLGEHFKPLILLLTPLYWVWQDPRMLLLLQTLTLTLAVIPVYLIARRRLSPLLTVLACALYLWNPLTIYLGLYEFHVYPFVIPILFTAAYFFIEKRYTLFLLFACASLLVREDIPFIVFMFGAVALLERRPWKWVVVPSAIATAYFFFAQAVIRAYNPEDSYKYLLYFRWLGTSMGEVAVNFFVKWQEVLAHYADPQVLYLLVSIMLFFAGTILPRPRWLLLALPALLITPLHNFVAWMLIKNHYSIPFLVAGTLASIEGIAWLAQRRTPKEPVLLGICAVAFLIYLQVWFGPLPEFAQRVQHSASESLVNVWNLQQHIPADASVVAPYDGLASLSGRARVYSLYYTFLGKQQFELGDYMLPADLGYVLLDSQDIMNFHLSLPKTRYAHLLSGGGKRLRTLLSPLTLVGTADTHLLYARGGTDAGLYAYKSYQTEPAPIVNRTLKESNGLIYLGSAPHADGVSYFFKKTGDPDDLICIKTGTTCTLLGYGIYPPADWKPGEVVETRLYTKNTQAVLERITGDFEFDMLASARTTLHTEEKLFSL